MTRAGWILAAAILLAGLVVCPRSRVPKIDPNRLLRLSVRAETGVNYMAEQTMDSVSYGKRQRSRYFAEWVPSDRALVEHCKAGIAWNLRLLDLNYTASIDGEGRIAGRDVWVVRVSPARPDRPWKQLWMDKRSHLVLALRDWSSRRQIKTMMTTTKITYGIARHAYPTSPLPEPQGLPSIPNALVRPRYVPDGFVLEKLADLGKRGARLTYSDGLFLLAAFVGEVANREAGSMKPGQLYDWGQGLMLYTHHHDVGVLVIGDLPADEIARVADSVR